MLNSQGAKKRLIMNVEQNCISPTNEQLGAEKKELLCELKGMRQRKINRHHAICVKKEERFLDFALLVRNDFYASTEKKIQTC